MANEPTKSKKTPCPKCGNPLRLSGVQRGEQVRCPKCNATFTVGGASPTKAKAKPGPEQPGPSKNLFAADELFAPEESRGPAEPPASDEPLALDEPIAFEVPAAAKKPIITYEPTATFTPGADERVTFDDSSAPGDELSVDNLDDDDAYEPEIPLQQYAPVPAEEMSDIGRHGGIDSEYEVDWESAEKLEAETPIERPPANTDLYLESARRRGMIRDDEEPDPPRWTFLSGVFGYPWRGANLTRWAAVSLGLSVANLVDYEAIQTAGLFADDLTQSNAYGIVQIAFGVAITLAVLSYAVACCWAAIIDTSEGHAAPQEDTLPPWDQWIITLVAWLSLGAAAAGVGYPLTLAIGPQGFLITLVAFFPILLLSAMETDSYVMPFSAPVLRTLVTYAHGWLAFYILSTALVALAAAAFVYGIPDAPTATCLLMGPVMAAFLLIYARLLGRLAWAGSGGRAPLAPRAERKARREAAEAALAKSRKGKRRRRKQIVVPEAVEPADNPPDQDPHAGRPRINFHHRP